MNETKIRLSEQEMQMVVNAELILTKNRIIEKAGLLLSSLQHSFHQVIPNKETGLPDEVLNTSAKISRGENYEGLPYLILDYPRYFTKPDIFAIRTMFWWGHFFSITLHLSGKYKDNFIPKIVNAYSLLKDAGFQVSAGDEEWVHHFERNNYLPLSLVSEAEFYQIMKEGSFLKLAKKYSLSDWPLVAEKLERDFILLTGVCSR